MLRAVGFVLVFAAIAAASGACASTGASDSGAGGKPVLVINMTSGPANLHSAWMGLSLARHGLADGRDVIVFMNVAAPPLASDRIPGSVTFGSESIRDVLAEIIEGGGKVIVCPSCMELTGVKDSELLPGVELADRDKLFGSLNPNSVVFSY